VSTISVITAMVRVEVVEAAERQVAPGRFNQTQATGLQ